MSLKRFLFLLVGMVAMNVNAQMMTLDEAKIRSNINSFSALADQGAFEYLGRLLGPVDLSRTIFVQSKRLLSKA